MQGKLERFQKWRGTRADSDRNEFDTAMLISDYLDSVSSLAVIKSEAEKKFEDFAQKNNRSWGLAVFTKLFIEEAIEQLPDRAVEEKKLLTDSSNIISHLYDNWKDDTKNNILNLLENIEKLLAIDAIPFTHSKHYKSFILSSYMLFHIVRLSMENIDWRLRLIAELIVDLKKIKSDIVRALQIIEIKAEHLEQLLHREHELEDDFDSDVLKPLKDLLNKRYLRVLNAGPFIEKSNGDKLVSQMTKNTPQNKLLKRDIILSIAELERDVAKVSSGIGSVLELKNKKNEIEAKIQLMTAFVSKIEESKRGSFLEFLQLNSDRYELLLENIDENRKSQHIEKINHLKDSIKNTSVSTGIKNTVSWVATPLTKVYRATPKIVQDMLAAALPFTFDELCFEDLKELAQLYLSELQQKLEKRESQIAAISNRLLYQDEALKKLIAKESYERLFELKKANDEIKKGIQMSHKLLVSIKNNSDFLHEFKEKSEILHEFVSRHDGFFVKICNFLARYFSFFKTDTAKMIDEALVLQKRVDELSHEYQRTVNKELHQIEHHPELSKSLKINIKKRFSTEQNEIKQGHHKKRMTPNKHNVRILMTDLSLLFSKKPEPSREQLDAILNYRSLIRS